MLFGVRAASRTKPISQILILGKAEDRGGKRRYTSRRHHKTAPINDHSYLRSIVRSSNNTLATREHARQL